jgi:hypothetical protein
MTAVLLALVWLLAASISLAAAAVGLQPVRDRALRVPDLIARRIALRRVDWAFAAVVAGVVAAFLYLVFGALLPLIADITMGTIAGLVLMIPLIAYVAMVQFARLGTERTAPSLGIYVRYLRRITALVMMLVVLPALLEWLAAPGFFYPLALYGFVLALLLGAFRTARLLV